MTVTVVIEGKMVQISGAAAKVILFVVENAATINSKQASGVIQLHIGGAEENVRAKYELSPAMD